MSAATLSPHVQLMDRMYALQRHFYDLTRKYYLFGRDRLIERMSVAPHHNVLEIGCGTGRNLILLAKKHANAAPSAKFFGLDAAHVMIDTAQSKVARRHLQNNITLRQALAEDLNPALFNVEKFDRIFFSYSLSMIPTWPAALETALQHLAPDGELWIVDFWDQSDYPAWFQGTLKTWLKLFHVHFRPELLAHLQQMHASHRGALTLESVGNRYAYLARWTNAV
ncbi:MAG TPA: class I SAM-dependent methyltransferase [Phycisphaerae bacterium]|nr:class I SAM-dependent methyltransferase [Phycisphaerae bacterium]